MHVHLCNFICIIFMFRRASCESGPHFVYANTQKNFSKTHVFVLDNKVHTDR